MRNVAAVLVAIIFLIPAARAATVQIGRPHIVFLSDAKTALACQSPNRRGCTSMQTEFFCNCVRTGETWSLNARLLVTPWVYTTTHDIMQHELRHISDVRGSLNEYAATLMLRSFPSEKACASFVDEEKELFGNTMRNIQRSTIIRRDGVQFADRPDDH